MGPSRDIIHYTRQGTRISLFDWLAPHHVPPRPGLLLVFCLLMQFSCSVCRFIGLYRNSAACSLKRKEFRHFLLEAEARRYRAPSPWRRTTEYAAKTRVRTRCPAISPGGLTNGAVCRNEAPLRAGRGAWAGLPETRSESGSQGVRDPRFALSPLRTRRRLHRSGCRAGSVRTASWGVASAGMPRAVEPGAAVLP